MAQALNTKSPCCNAGVSYSYYHRYGFAGPRLHRWCQKCNKHYIKGTFRIEKREDWTQVKQKDKQND